MRPDDAAVHSAVVVRVTGAHAVAGWVPDSSAHAPMRPGSSGMAQIDQFLQALASFRTDNVEVAHAETAQIDRLLQALATFRTEVAADANAEAAQTDQLLQDLASFRTDVVLIASALAQIDQPLLHWRTSGPMLSP